jgi:hypothetical protein
MYGRLLQAVSRLLTGETGFSIDSRDHEGYSCISEAGSPTRHIILVEDHGAQTHPYIAKDLCEGGKDICQNNIAERDRS